MSVLVDVNTFIGGYPFRHVPHPDVASLLAVLDRERIGSAVTGYLPAAWHRSPSEANRELLRQTSLSKGRLLPAPAVNPGWPDWEEELDWARSIGAPAVRCYPAQWHISETAASMREFVAACAEKRITVILTARFEDARQRHWMDAADDLSAAHVRYCVQAHPMARVILTAAGRGLIEELHWSFTPAERERVWYDVSWIWGPPGNDLQHLVETIGPGRFLFGSMWPLRLVQNPIAGIELLSGDARAGMPGDALAALPLLAAAASTRALASR